MYYMIFNKNNKKYYWGKSKDPQKSIEDHIKRANDPTSKRYNTPLHKALREEGIENFNFFKFEYPPEWAYHFGKYLSD